jgi:hypothetical protein
MADQERIVSLELLSKRYLLRLGTIEKLLLNRPKIAIPLHDNTPLITGMLHLLCSTLQVCAIVF